MKFKEYIKDFFTFSRREQRGSAVLFSIILLLITYQFAQRYFFTPKVYDFSSFEKEIGELEIIKEDEIKFKEKKKYSPKTKFPSKKNTNNSFEGFVFNPNSIGLEEWKRLGLSEKQARSILKYLSKGGKFKIKSDLKKMYTISPKKYIELEQWIDLPIVLKPKEYSQENIKKEGDSISTFNKNANFSYPEKAELELKSINLNTADTSMLKTIKGIGGYYAGKIIEYRDQLGGFYRVDQLSEIWKMREETIFALEPYVFIEDSDVILLSINNSTLEELKIHPYISWKIANSIVNYRIQHGKYKSLSDLEKLIVIKKDELEKIKPYLKI